MTQHRGPASLWLLTAALAVASGLVWRDALTLGGAPHGAWLPWWGIALAFYAAEAWPVHVHFKKQVRTLSLMEIGLVFGLFFATPMALFAWQLAGAGVAIAVHRRRRPVKLFFNIVEQSLCAGTALLVFRMLGGAGDGRLWVAALVALGVARLLGV